MALERNRTRIGVKGLGKLEIRELSPTPGTSFLDVGYIGDTTVIDEREMEDLSEAGGNMVDVKEKIARAILRTEMLQSSVDELNLVTLAEGKLYAVRYFGSDLSTRFQYFAIDKARLVPGINLNLGLGRRGVAMEFRSLEDSQELGYSVPLYYMNELAGTVALSGLQLWIDPVLGLNDNLAKILDVSGFARHGTLSPSGDVATIWQDTTTPAHFLRFDGVNDVADFGDILDDDGTSDFVIELWVRVQAADGARADIMSKIAASVGWRLLRYSNNAIIFNFGAGVLLTINPPSTVLQNVWTHIAIIVDRNGNATGYKNGAAGSPQSVAATGSAANASALKLGYDTAGGLYGQVDIGSFRMNKWTAGGLPSDIATTILNHYNAEKSRYGL